MVLYYRLPFIGYLIFYLLFAVSKPNTCVFQSKVPVNMTDEEWLLFLEKKFQVLKYFTSPARAYGRGIERPHVFYCEMFMIGSNLTIFPVWL